ncbi:MAG: PRTRC system ThiF family protein [Flavisolibacter sp.]|nr:PRTRC system ThiF family protein [Flavisolibacter sp.]
MTNSLPRVHFAPSELLNPLNPITVNIIGAGGTGSKLLTGIARINHCLLAGGRCGLHVRLFDDDIISEANRGRQLFTSAEVGLNKSVVLINRINRAFGTNWKAVPSRYNKEYCSKHGESTTAVITVGCVDNVASRLFIVDFLKWMARDTSHYTRNRPTYYIDFGNSRHTGQVVFSTLSKVKQPDSKKFQPVDTLPLITEEFGQLLKESGNDDNTPSCSLAEALYKQSLFINSSLAELGGSLLSELFMEGMIFNRGFFHNLKSFNTSPIPV